MCFYLKEFQCMFLYHLKELPSLQGSLTLLDPVCELLRMTGAGILQDQTEGVTLVQCLYVHLLRIKS